MYIKLSVYTHAHTHSCNFWLDVLGPILESLLTCVSHINGWPISSKYYFITWQFRLALLFGLLIHDQGCVVNLTSRKLNCLTLEISRVFTMFCAMFRPPSPRCTFETWIANGSVWSCWMVFCWWKGTWEISWTVFWFVETMHLVDDLLMLWNHVG